MDYTVIGEEKYNELYDLYPLQDIRVFKLKRCGGLACITKLKHYSVYDAWVYV
jgi:hypothetical protein